MTDRVVLRLRGLLLERFVARALEEGVCFGRVERVSPQEMHFAAPEKQARRLLALAEEYRMDLTVLREEGVPNWRRRLRERGTILLGLGLGLFLVTAFASRIWRIETTAMDDRTDPSLLQEIGQYAAEWGAAPGTERASLDRKALAMDIQARWPQLTYVSVELSGVCLRVEVAAEEAPPEIYEIDAGRDLVASRDSVVTYVEPLAGQAAVKPGDTVRRGQVLIRGEERIDAETTRGIRALGSVMGRVWFTARLELPLSRTTVERTGRSRSAGELRLGPWRWTIRAADSFGMQETEEEIIPVGGLYIPLCIARTTLWEVQGRTEAIGAEQLLPEGEAAALERARSLLPEGAQETCSWTEWQEENGRLIVQATVEAQMDIASERAAVGSEFSE